MPQHLRFQSKSWATHFVTTRCIHGYLLFRPNESFNRLMIGCIGRSLSLFSGRVELNAVVVMSNHYHMLLSTESARALSEFMCVLNSNIARVVNRFHHRSGYVFERRFASEEQH